VSETASETKNKQQANKYIEVEKFAYHLESHVCGSCDFAQPPFLLLHKKKKTTYLL